MGILTHDCHVTEHMIEHMIEHIEHMIENIIAEPASMLVLDTIAFQRIRGGIKHWGEV